MHECDSCPAPRPSLLRCLAAAVVLTVLVAATALGSGSADPGDGPVAAAAATDEQAGTGDETTDEQAGPRVRSIEVPATRSAGSGTQDQDAPEHSGSHEGHDHEEPSHRTNPQESSEDEVVASVAREQTTRYSMLGVTWEPGTAPADLHVEVRSRGADGWSSWSDVATAGHGPEAGADSGTRAGTAPVWVDDAEGVEVRARSATGTAPSDLRVELIDPGEAPDPPQQSVDARATGMPRIISRSGWGADESMGDQCWSPRYGPTLKGVVVHHTVNSNGYSESQSDNIVRGILAYHTQSQGWCDIGYNFLVDRFGNIFEGRDGGVRRVVRGAHAGNGDVNKVTAGISLIGRFESGRGYPSAAMKTALVRLAAWKLSRHDRDPHAQTWIGGGRYPVVAGHRDVHSTACPGGHLYTQLPRLRDRIAHRIKNASNTSRPAGVPQNVRVRLVGNDVRIRWDAASGDAREYLVYDSRRKGYRVGGSGLREAWLWNVEPGETYYVGVRARNSDGVGRLVGEKVDAPGAPRNLRVRLTGNDLRLTWDAASGDAREYLVYDSRRKGYRVGGSGLRKAWLWNVQPGETYYVGVRTRNSDGIGPMLGKKVSTPGAPRNVRVDRIGNDVRIRWDRAPGDAREYLVYDSRRKGYRVGGPRLREAWLWNVEPGETHYLGVRTRSPVGIGPMEGTKVRGR